ncbi:MAG: tetratricopeptide repeat protein [Verrucomicrobiales bacterium]
MDSRFFRISSIIVLGLLLGKIIYDRSLPEEEVNSMLVVFEFIIVAAIAGTLFVTWLLPSLTDKFSEAMLGSGDKIEETQTSIATAKLAQGDYEGAILEFEKMAAANPSDRQPVVEISRVYRDKLDDPDSAIQTIHTALISREWKPEDEAFFLLRLADLYSKDKRDFGKAREVVDQVLQKHHGTPHAANATHKLRQIEEEEFIASRET